MFYHTVMMNHVHGLDFANIADKGNRGFVFTVGDDNTLILSAIIEFDDIRGTAIYI